MQQTVSRRSVIAGMFAGAAFLAVDRFGTFAQDATPETSPASGGPDMSAYPQLDVTITDSDIQVSMTTVPAGWVLLSVTNSSSDENAAGVLGPGEGQTMDDLVAAAATPPADPEGFPPFLDEAAILGGPGSMSPGESAQALLDISAGDWAVFPEGNQQPVFITAAESADSNTTAPNPDLKIQAGRLCLWRLQQCQSRTTNLGNHQSGRTAAHVDNVQGAGRHHRRAGVEHAHGDGHGTPSPTP